MQLVHSNTSCHLGAFRKLRKLERFCWWVGFNQRVRWWTRPCFKWQARKLPQKPVRWPVISIPLSDGPDDAMSLDYLDSFPATSNSCNHILLITDRFSHRAAMYSATAANVSAADTANILVGDYIPKWDCPKSMLADNGRLVMSFCVLQVSC